jgi:lipopolysaccharide transport system ATP-binding protein
MAPIRIQARGLSKLYRLGQRAERYLSLRDVLASLPRRWLGHVSAGRDTFWALRDVSFEVREGEVIGIVGRNGAGKSTLLKILSRITEPTDGEAIVHGRVGSLLEIGTGFHPELTGRENVYLNGAILGMKRREIDRRFAEIVAFAEVERFLDTAVKHYSSGMYLRLAFAVAAHLEPEILLVDEVLAVGDAEFQKKCLGKMSEVSGRGRTVLFVSHNMTAVRSFCSRAIWLDEGEIREEGEAHRVVSAYLQTSFRGVREKIWDRDTAPGNDAVQIRVARVRRIEGTPSDSITVRTPFFMEFEFSNFVPGARLNLSIHVVNQEGVTVFNTFPLAGNGWNERPFPEGLFRSTCTVPGDLLNEGTYRIVLLVVKDQGVVIYRNDDILAFEISEDPNRGTKWYGKWAGVTRPILTWQTEYLGTSDTTIRS